MPIKYPPLPGTILRCDFNSFKEPEMSKVRPIIVLSPKIKNTIRNTILVVPLSTTAPKPICKYHLQVSLPGDILPKGLQRECWVKGDMIYALSLERLSMYHFDRDKISGKRAYYECRFLGQELHDIRKAVMHAVGIHLPEP
ncbi:MAG: type II toxin-antitoxin system PemK/MazF family toxin [Pseudomonadota bacterium]